MAFDQTKAELLKENEELHAHLRAKLDEVEKLRAALKRIAARDFRYPMDYTDLAREALR